MKIVNLEKHEAYQLQPGAKLEVERTNPFFNDYAEHTTPLDLPASDHNRRLLGFPDLFGGRVKMVTSDVSIQDGEFHAQCRQAVLSATRKGTIQTSFYLNDGSLYARLQNTKLKDVFSVASTDIIEFSSMEAVLTFCRGLRANTDERFSIFPILVTDDSGMDHGYNYKVVNGFGKDEEHSYDIIFNASVLHFSMTITQTCFNPDKTGSGCDFYNAQTRTEIVNQIPISIDPGYYISPFIRMNYVLQRIFAHLGYTLEENFLTHTQPFDKMVLLNNVIDPLIKKKLIVADLLPDVTVPEMLAAVRRKFCCEFSVDEATKTVGIVFLKDIVGGTPTADLTGRMAEEPTIGYKSEKDFKRLRICAEDTVDSEVSDNYDDMKAMTGTDSAAYLDDKTGEFFKTGYSGDYRVDVKIGEASQPYDTGEALEAEELKIPERIPEPRTLIYTYTDFNEDVQELNFGKFLYVGDYRTVNSKMIIAGEDNQESTDSSSKTLPMMAFAATTDGRASGTISPYSLREGTWLWPYALYYNGSYGIFEKFHRDHDLLLRNSLMEVKARLMLTQSEKQSLPAWAKVTIRGVAFLLNKLKFTLGGKDEPQESQLLTIGLYHDAEGNVSQAPAIGDMLPMMTTAYKWVGHQSVEETDASTYDNSGVDKERTFQTIYPPVPSAEYVGQRYGEQVSYTEKQTRHSTLFRSSRYEYTKTTVWLECVHV